MREEAYPLCWPEGRRRNVVPVSSRFSDVAFGRARDTLFHEIELLPGSKIILSTNIPLRQDGLPYATYAQPKDKGVAIYFQYKKKPMVFACDEWNKIEHNIWAIAKTIEALRGIERWGSGDMLERAFTGFTKLPSPSTKKHWREILGFMGAGPVPEFQLQDRKIELSLKNHPDHGGDTLRMAEINHAFDEAIEELR